MKNHPANRTDNVNPVANSTLNIFQAGRFLGADLFLREEIPVRVALDEADVAVDDLGGNGGMTSTLLYLVIVPPLYEGKAYDVATWLRYALFYPTAFPRK